MTIVDRYHRREMPHDEQIVAGGNVGRCAPPPLRSFIGYLSDTSPVLEALRIDAEKV